MSELGDALRAEAGECEDYGTRALLPDLAARADALEVELIHRATDAELMRTTALRKANLAVELAETAEASLTNGDYHVTAEYVSRVLGELYALKQFLTNARA